MANLDADKDVLEWSSEEVVIPYRSLFDGQMHRYFPDFWVRKSDGTYILEVKPFHQTQPPVPSKKRTKRYINYYVKYFCLK